MIFLSFLYLKYFTRASVYYTTRNLTRFSAARNTKVKGGFRASDWISLFSFGLYKGGFRSRRWISWISLF